MGTNKWKYAWILLEQGINGEIIKIKPFLTIEDIDTNDHEFAIKIIRELKFDWPLSHNGTISIKAIENKGVPVIGR